MSVTMDASARMSPSVENSADQTNAELQTILNAVMDGVCGLDADGQATFCNDALVQMTGYGAKEIVGQKIYNLLHPGHSAKKYPASQCELRQRAEAHQPAHMVGESLWRKNGTCFPAECWLRPLQRPASRTTHV